MKKSLLFLYLFLISTFANAQQAGDLDTSFGINGKVTTNITTTDVLQHIYDQAIQKDGKIILVGNEIRPLGINGFLKRLNIDGSLDLTFADNGTFSSYDMYFELVKIQSDDKIVVTGRSNIWRFNSSGTLDTSFGIDGLTKIPVNNASSNYQNIIDFDIQLDDKILILHSGTESGGYPNCNIVRYNYNGEVDPTFANNGRLTFSIGQSRPKCILIQPDQKILVGYNFSGSPGMWGGYKFFRIDNNGSNERVISYNANDPQSSYIESIAIQADNKILMINTQGIYRYNTDLSIDNTFGVNGFIPNITSDLGTFYAYKIKTQPNGKINVLSKISKLKDTYLSQYNSNGTLDNTFNGDGNFNLQCVSINSPYSNLGIYDNNILLSSGFGCVSKINSQGSLNPAFGINGEAFFEYQMGSDDVSTKSILQKDGKLLVCGITSNTIVSIVRYNINGALDTTFANQGKYTYKPELFKDRVAFNDIGIQSDGKIIFTCQDLYSIGSLILRLNTNGVIDETFGTNGVLQINIPHEYYYNQSLKLNLKTLTVLQDDKILISGNDDDDGLIFIKLNADGSYDTSFNTIGYKYFKDSLINISMLLIQNDGKIILGGYYGDIISMDIGVIARFNSDGSQDLSFGDNGLFKILIKSNIKSIALQNDGKILITGYTPTSTSPFFEPNNFKIYRINPEGTLDTTFGENGVTQTTIENFCTATAIKVLQNQKILVSGFSSGTDRNFAMVKYNTDGSLDTSFGDQGKAITDFNGADDESNSILITDNNNIIVTGFTINPILENKDFALAKYDVNGFLGIEKNEKIKKVLFYPNPTKDYIHFNQSIKAVSIYSIDGKLMISKLENNTLDLSNLSKGVYLIQITDENEAHFVQKVVKE